MALSRPKLSVVLPVYNEERNVAAMAARLAEIAKAFGPIEILFVDDCSTDATLAEVKRLAERDPRVRFVAFTRNFGHQAALRAGLRYARGEAVVLMDCDFEHPPELVPAMVAEWQRGAKVVLYSTTNVSSIAQYGAVGAMEGSQQCIDDFKKELLFRRDMFYKGVQEAAPGVFSGTPPDGAFYAFLKINADFAKNAGIKGDSLSWAMAEFLIKNARIGCVPVTAEVSAALLDNPGGYYVNVHTRAFPSGAIRGQLSK